MLLAEIKVHEYISEYVSYNSGSGYRFHFSTFGQWHIASYIQGPGRAYSRAWILSNNIHAPYVAYLILAQLGVNK